MRAVAAEREQEREREPSAESAYSDPTLCSGGSLFVTPRHRDTLQTAEIFIEAGSDVSQS